MRTPIIPKLAHPRDITSEMMNELPDLEDNAIFEEYHEEDDFWLWFWDVLFGGTNKRSSDEDK